MAEEFANFYESLLDGAIDDDDTTVTVDSTTGSSDATGRLVIQDGETDETNREIVTFSAKTATTFTVARGQEGTTAVAHGDNSYIAQVLTAGGLEQGLADAVATVTHGAWTSFTPTWTTTGTAPAIGNGTLSGRYKQLDSKTYAIHIRFVAGSTTTYGTGTWEFALPAGLTSTSQIGSQLLAGYIEDSGTDNKLCVGVLFGNATKVGQIVPEAGNVVTNTAPQTWAQNDKLGMSGVIEVA